MTQKAKPEERTILQALAELAGYEDVRTSEDLGQLSESKFMQRWGLPLMTGVEMETEDYDPGAVDAAFAALPFVGGPLKTGFKLAKEGAKRVGRAYKRAVRPRVFPQKDELLREERLQRQWGSVEPEESLGITERISNQLLDMRQRLGLEPSSGSYQPGTYAQQVAEEAVHTQQTSLFGDLAPAPQPVAQAARSADEVAQSIVNEFGFSSNVSWNEAQSIVSDIGEEGWTRYHNELRSIPLEQRELHLENFLAKYRVTGQLSGQDAAVAYKARRFTSKMPDETMVINKGRHGELLYTSTTVREGKSRIELKWTHPTNEWASASLDFDIASKVDDAGNAFEEISGISFFASHDSRRYAGRLMSELLKKIPDNAVINESSMTYDALYTLLRQSIRKNAKIVFHKTNPKFPSGMRRKQASGASRLSPWSIKFEEAKELYRSTGDPKHIDKAVDEIMDEMRGMINEYAKKRPERVVGRPQIEAVKEVGKDYLSYGPDPGEFLEKGRFEYNFISIHKMAGILAGAFGFKNREELMKFISYDPESTEAQVFDNEFSL